MKSIFQKILLFSLLFSAVLPASIQAGWLSDRLSTRKSLLLAAGGIATFFAARYFYGWWQNKRKREREEEVLKEFSEAVKKSDPDKIIELVESMKKCGIQFGRELDKNFLLHKAIEFGGRCHKKWRKIAKECIVNGAKVDLKDSDGNTPLHWVAGNSAKEGGEFLVNSIDDRSSRLIFIRMRNNEGKTALDIAKERKCIGAVKYLLEQEQQFQQELQVD